MFQSTTAPPLVAGTLPNLRLQPSGYVIQAVLPTSVSGVLVLMGAVEEVVRVVVVGRLVGSWPFKEAERPGEKVTLAGVMVVVRVGVGEVEVGE